MSMFARARRFTIQTRVLYRRPSEPRWDEGTTLNVSRSGILFSTKAPLPPGTPVEMVLWLSSDVLDMETSADVVCLGQVVRVEHKTTDAALAATIASYRFTSGRAPLTEM